ncbi:hypothetical protein KBTX_02414 [wastewater metagenome]|uniref:Signaling protein n=3 Tax=root TaxID=1 RepID=A0A5B8RGU9_9ZZZZ|nr:EAL domain-containing protein [Arhodomonas aquaeolei]QEA06085.1 hypothetical protein KBTEX_02414 [uncultured organism]
MNTKGQAPGHTGVGSAATERLLQVADALTLEPDFERFFTRAAEAARGFVEADGAALILCTDDDRLEYQFFNGALRRLARFAGLRFAQDEGLVGRALRAGHTLFTPDYADDGHAMAAFVNAGLRANLIIPLIGSEGAIGALALSWFRPVDGPPETEAVLLAEKVAGQIAVACQRRMLEHRLEAMVRTDELTGLLNRAGMMERLNQRLAGYHRDGTPFAVVVIDMDGFKTVNDRLGHASGDAVLCHTAERLHAVCRRNDDIARMGGDEFVILADGAHGSVALDSLLARIARTLSEPATMPRTFRCTASMGSALCPEHGASPEALLGRADMAMYRAKSRGGAELHRFDAAMERASRERESLAEDLARALEDGELRVHYQAIFAAPGEVPPAAECLVRWQHPTRGLLPAAAFMPAVEAGSRRLVRDIDRWVLNAALSQIRDWRRRGIPHPTLHVNVSARNFIAGDFSDHLARTLALYPEVPPETLVLELTETSLIDNMSAAAETAAACRRLNVRLALDDFGTGYASLTYLKRLSVDMVKIDGDFVGDIFDNPNSDAILRGILAMSRALGLDTVVEGVETVAHADILRSLGCDLLQGFGLARPVPVDALVPEPSYAGAM